MPVTELKITDTLIGNGKRTLFVPADLAYGERQIGKYITPNSNLIFYVELLEVRPRE